MKYTVYKLTTGPMRHPELEALAGFASSADAVTYMDGKVAANPSSIYFFISVDGPVERLRAGENKNAR